MTVSPDGRTSDDAERFAYEGMLLAFVDILGWSELVYSIGADRGQMFSDVLRAAGILRSSKDNQDRQVARADELLAQGLKLAVDLLPEISHFSDTIVWSCKPNASATYGLVEAVQGTCVALLREGYLSRGAIVYGEIYHRDGTVFGPALVDAYTLESSVAVYPRVLVDDSAREWIPRNFVFEDASYVARDTRVDVDGLVYLDILGGLRAGWGDAPRPSLPGGKALMAEVQARFNAQSDARRRAKWGWMLHYLAQVESESLGWS